MQVPRDAEAGEGERVARPLPRWHLRSDSAGGSCSFIRENDKSFPRPTFPHQPLHRLQARQERVISGTVEHPHTDTANQDPVGGRESVDRLLPLVYDELRRIAHRHISARGDGSTLNTTALVHEAYLRLVDQSRIEMTDGTHFLAVAALAMRHILIDRARARTSLKRGGDAFRVTLDDNVVAPNDAPEALLQLSDALDRLATIDSRLARVVEYRFFGGMTNAEIASSLGVTERTVERDWIKARMLLREQLVA